MKNQAVSRRAFLCKLGGLGAAGIGSGLLLAACGGEQQAGGGGAQATGAAPDPTCTNVAGLTADQLEAREGLGYVSDSPHPDTLCNNCQFWIPAAEGQLCGGCVIIKGPIHPEGYCNYWAPQTEA